MSSTLVRRRYPSQLQKKCRLRHQPNSTCLAIAAAVNCGFSSDVPGRIMRLSAPLRLGRFCSSTLLFSVVFERWLAPKPYTIAYLRPVPGRNDERAARMAIKEPRGTLTRLTAAATVPKGPLSSNVTRSGVGCRWAGSSAFRQSLQIHSPVPLPPTSQATPGTVCAAATASEDPAAAGDRLASRASDRGRPAWPGAARSGRPEEPRYPLERPRSPATGCRAGSPARAFRAAIVRLFSMRELIFARASSKRSAAVAALIAARRTVLTPPDGIKPTGLPVEERPRLICGSRHELTGLAVHRAVNLRQMRRRSQRLRSP